MCWWGKSRGIASRLGALLRCRERKLIHPIFDEKGAHVYRSGFYVQVETERFMASFDMKFLGLHHWPLASRLSALLLCS